jgi:tellurite resistance protein
MVMAALGEHRFWMRAGRCRKRGMPISLRSPHTLDEPKLEALVEIMYLAARADGEFGEDERRHFERSVQSLTDRKVTGELFDRLMDRLDEAHRASGREARLRAARERLGSPEACRVALDLAIGVTMADGVARPSERAMLLEIASALGIPLSEAEEMLRLAVEGS